MPNSKVFAEPVNIRIGELTDTEVAVVWEDDSGKTVSNYEAELSLNNVDWFPSPWPATIEGELSFQRPKSIADTNLYFRVTSEYDDMTSSAPVSQLITIPGLEFANSTQFSVSEREVILSDSERKAIDEFFFWADGNIGFFERNGEIISLSPNSSETARSVGTQDDPFASFSDIDIEIQDQDIVSDYAAGGPVYYDEPNDRLLMFYHGELHDPSPTDFYAYIGMAQSYDGGETFEDLGQIIRADMAVDEPGRIGTVEMAGAPYAIKDGYFYVYFKDKLADNNVINMAVARASVADVLAAADLGNTTTWQKYANGSFSVNAIGNEPDEILPVSPYAIWSDVAYIEELNKFVMVFPTENNSSWHTMITTSDDGVNWEKPEFLFGGASLEDEVTFTTISSLDFSDQRNISGNQFYVYQTVSASEPDTGNRWEDARVERFTVSFSTDNNGSGSDTDQLLASTGTHHNTLVTAVGVAVGSGAWLLNRPRRIKSSTSV